MPISFTQDGETRAVVQPNSASFAACETVNPAATSCPNRPVTRNLFSASGWASALRVMLAEGVCNSRSVVSSSANDCVNRVAASQHAMCETVFGNSGSTLCSAPIYFFTFGTSLRRSLIPSNTNRAIDFNSVVVFNHVVLRVLDA